MEKISINLFPSQDTNEKKISKVVEQYFPYVFLALVGVIIINILLFLITSLSYIPYNNLTKKWEELGPQAKTIEEVKQELIALKEVELAYTDLVKRNMDLSRVIAEIVASLPKNIWLDRFIVEDGYVKITSYVVEWKEDFSETINTFINNLQNQEYFSSIFKDINPQGRRKELLFKRDVMRFEVECRS